LIIIDWEIPLRDGDINLVGSEGNYMDVADRIALNQQKIMLSEAQQSAKDVMHIAVEAAKAAKAAKAAAAADAVYTLAVAAWYSTNFNSG
jgi:hypothetical protein